MSANIMFINPVSSRNQFTGEDNYFPTGILSLATVLNRRGDSVRIRDVNNDFFNSQEVNHEIIEDYIDKNIIPDAVEFNPDIIGLGCIFSGAFPYLLLISKKMKSLFPQASIVIGGMHPTIFAKTIIERYDWIDYVVVGEGEISFPQLVDYIKDAKGDLAKIDGLAYRGAGEVRLNEKSQFYDKLDELPAPDYSLLNVDEYKMDTSKWYNPLNIPVGQPFPILSSRSCPLRCTFCSMWLAHGPTIRYRSPKLVLDEMEHVYNKYGTRYFQFMDDNLTFDKGRTLAICNGIKDRGMKIQFDTPNGVAINKLDQEIIDAMVNAGMIRISIAIESGSEYIRNKVMRKGLRDHKIYEVVNACMKHHHLYVNGFFIIGMPEETHETLEETYKMIEELPLDKYALSYATPFPGTFLFNYCAEHNLLPFPKEKYVDLDNLQARVDYPHFIPHALEGEDLVKFRERAYAIGERRRAESKVPGNHPLRFNMSEPIILASGE